MPHKLFEAEIGRSLNAIPLTFWLKPLDGVMWAAERVDFHGVYKGRAANIECKEVPSEKSFRTAMIAKNQLNCVRYTEIAGGLGLILVNFGRKRGGPGERSRGFLAVYRSSDLYHYVPDGPAGILTLRKNLTPEDAFECASALGGGLWQVDWLNRLTAGEKGMKTPILLPGNRGLEKVYRDRQHHDESAFADGGHIISRRGEG